MKQDGPTPYDLATWIDNKRIRYDMSHPEMLEWLRKRYGWDRQEAESRIWQAERTGSLTKYPIRGLDT